MASRGSPALNKSKMKPAKVFKTAVEPSGTPPSPGQGSRSPQAQQGPRHITGLSFDDRGDQCITAAEDETFRLYNCKSGKRVPSVLQVQTLKLTLLSSLDP